VSKECSAVIRTPQTGKIDKTECKNGFLISGACFGTAGTPMCLKEEVCGRLYDLNGGKPVPLSDR
jgi:hypothetical protein